MTKNTISIDGTETSFSCDGQDTVLRAALRENISFPYECNSGGCGSCKFELLDGEVEELWPDAPGLSRRDLRKGKKLACQCRPRGDIIIKVSPTEEGGEKDAPLPQRQTLVYQGRNDLTVDMAEFIFKAEDGTATFLPGQFALLTLRGVQGDRAYSMSNTPNADGLWQFIIKKMPNGAGSAFMFNKLQTGEIIEMDGPYGLAHLRKNNTRDIVCIAGGSGLSPVMSIVRATATDPEFSGRKVHVFYGGRTPEDLCAEPLVKKLKACGTDIRCCNAISETEHLSSQSWGGPTGFIHECVAENLPGDFSNYEYYFCGPPPMTKAVQSLLMLEKKVPFDQLHFDRFF